MRWTPPGKLFRLPGQKQAEAARLLKPICLAPSLLFIKSWLKSPGRKGREGRADIVKQLSEGRSLGWRIYLGFHPASPRHDRRGESGSSVGSWGRLGFLLEGRTQAGEQAHWLHPAICRPLYLSPLCSNISQDLQKIPFFPKSFRAMGRSKLYYLYLYSSVYAFCESCQLCPTSLWSHGL